MTIHHDETQQHPVTQQLDEMGLDNGIVRNDGESDADYAERLVYELDVAVEDLWAVQDKIRELVKPE